ncbi:glycosyltransferase [Deltaproteobacteria bacterium TL4]
MKAPHKKEKPFRLLMTGGGSGGPTTPLLAVYDALGECLGSEGREGLFLGTKTGPERGMVERAHIPFVSIPSGKLRRYWSWRNFVDPVSIFLGFWISLKILWQFRPHVVVSAGSFVSVPVAYASWLLRIPHVILQMDVKPGLANRLMAPVSSILVYLFDKSAESFQIKSKIKIGPVVRSDIRKASAESANERFQLNPHKPVLLITGGGQGALKINQAVEKLLDHWLPHYQVVHLTGKDLAGVQKEHPDYHALSFIHEGMGDLLARSDLVITRAGLGIIGELASLAKDTILVPIPGTHQEINGRLLTASHAAIVLDQDVFFNDGKNWWDQFIRSYQPGVMGNNLKKLLPSGGTEAFAEILIKAGEHSAT